MACIAYFTQIYLGIGWFEISFMVLYYGCVIFGFKVGSLIYSVCRCDALPSGEYPNAFYIYDLLRAICILAFI
jgi:hypothetical protein